jgi:hypothetical protein
LNNKDSFTYITPASADVKRGALFCFAKNGTLFTVSCKHLCVPGMGMILWGVSPLYIIQKDTFYMITLKSTSRWQGWTGDRSLERSLSANLRANGQKQHSKAEPQGESAQHDEAHLDHCGMVNAVVVQRKIMSLPGEICLPKLPNGIGGTEPAKVRVNRAEVSRGRELNEFVEERSEGSVIGDVHELW